MALKNSPSGPRVVQDVGTGKGSGWYTSNGATVIDENGNILAPVIPGDIPLGTGNLLVGFDGVATERTMSGDATMNSSGVITVNKQKDLQFKDEGVNLGTSGTADTVDYVGAGVTATRIGDTVTVTVPGGSGGLSEFGYFFQQVADVGATIAADNGKALFQTASSNNTAGFTMVAASGDITVLNGGIYEIDWSLSAAEPGAMCVYINAAKQDVAGGTYGSGAGTQQNTGKCLLVLADNDVISLRTDNCAAALTLQLAGTTNTAQVVASIMLKKVS